MAEYSGIRSKALEALFTEPGGPALKGALKGPQKQLGMGVPATKPSAPRAALLTRLVRVHSIDGFLMGASGREAFVESAREQASSHGFTTTADVNNYLDLMVLFGHRFDVDPQLAWVGPALSKPWMAGLFENAIKYLGVISGETGDLYIKALLRARKRAPSSLVDSVCGSASELGSLLMAIHPEKYKAMSAQTPALFALARTLTAPHSKSVRPLYPVLMFLLGSHFETDPRYGWAAEILRSAETSESLRYKRLHEEAVSRLGRVLRSRGGVEPLVQEVG